MIGDTTEELWKESELERRSNGNNALGDLKRKWRMCLLSDGRRYKIKEVNVLQTMGPTITQEADSMSAMRLRMSKADKAPWMDMTFYKNNGIAEGWKHKR